MLTNMVVLITLIDVNFARILIKLSSSNYRNTAMLPTTTMYMNSFNIFVSSIDNKLLSQGNGTTKILESWLDLRQNEVQSINCGCDDAVQIRRNWESKQLIKQARRHRTIWCG